MLKLIMITGLLASLCACSDPGQGQAEADEESGPALTSGYQRSLEKARDVEDQVLEADEKRRKIIEEQQGGGG